MINIQYIYIVITFITISIIIYFNSLVHCKTTKYKQYDILSKNYNPTNYKFLDNYLDGWGISHFILYGVITYIYPKYWLFIFMIGVLWELFEYFLENNPKLNCYVLDDNTIKQKYWYARYQDVIMNLLGILTALIIKRY